MFEEKSTEKLNGKEIPVVQTNKYKEARAKAIKIIDEGKYGLTESNFWILMNSNRDKSTMYYSGLIISHNGCLKINDALPNDLKFKPECVTVDKDGYNHSLAAIYVCPEQGLFEVGEVSADNCKNPYVYAMCIKRLEDRVILKNSKLAYDGIYSESESDEFKEQPREKETKPKKEVPKCSKCGKIIDGYVAKNGKEVTPEEAAVKLNGLCVECYKVANTNA